MKKIISLSLSILLIICLMGTAYAVSSCKISLKINNSTLVKDEEFSVNVVLSDIQDEKGIFGVSAILEYDKNSLEYVKMEEQQGWEKAVYNKDNGIIAIIREESYATNNQTVFKITFKTKVENKSNVEIALKDVTASNGQKDIKLGDLKEILTIKTNNNNNNNENNKPNENNNNNSKPSSNNKPTNNNNDNLEDNNVENNNDNNDNNDNGNNSSENKTNNGNNVDINNKINNENSNINKPTNNISNEKTTNKGNAIILLVVGIALFVIIGIVLYIKKRK